MSTKGKGRGRGKGKASASMAAAVKDAYLESESASMAAAVKVAYMESDFVCSSPVLPGDLSGSLKAATAHGVKEAANELRLPRKLLHARPIGPLEKEDGSPFPVEEWANHYMVVVEAEPNGGLLARCKTQDALISGLMNQGVEDVSLRTQDVGLSIDLKQENKALKEENDALKLRLFNLQEQQERLTNDLSTKQLQLNISNLQAEKSSILSENAVLKAENEAMKIENKSLKVENDDLKKRVAFLEQRVAFLESKVADLTRDISDLKDKMTKLAGWEKILIRKMLDACRKKCKETLLEAKMQVPLDWNMIGQDAAMISVLNAKGLSKGLKATMYGVNTPQYQGSRAAHGITEDPDVYATIVCKMAGATKDSLLNVFEFVFGVSAEALEFKCVMANFDLVV